MAGNPQPFEDVVLTDDGFSIPELKWRELVFIGAGYRSESLKIDESGILADIKFAGPFVEVGVSF